MPAFFVEATLPGCAAWPGGYSASLLFVRLPDHGYQPGQGIFTVLFLASERLGLDVDDAVAADPVVMLCEETLFQLIGQAGCPDIEPQVDGTGDLVDVLATRPTGADGMKFDFMLRDGDAVSDPDQLLASGQSWCM